MSPLRIAIRTDASPQIGSGHLMRCLTLADALAERGARCTFVTRAGAGPLLESIRARGHALVLLDDEAGAGGDRPAGSDPDADLSIQARRGVNAGAVIKGPIGFWAVGRPWPRPRSVSVSVFVSVWREPPDWNSRRGTQGAPRRLEHSA